MKTAEDILNEKGRDIISVPVDATVMDALRVMNEHKIGAIVVQDGDEYVGIWTERDLLEDSLKDGFDLRTARIRDCMTTGLKSAPHDATCFALSDKFLGIRLRHLLIERDGRYVGLISTGDVIKANLMEKTRELRQLNAMVGWEYYENWRWKQQGKGS